MSRLKKFFFVFVFGLISGAVATLVYGTESHADNTGTYGFFIVHSTTCPCGNNNIYDTVILGSTHRYEIMPNAKVEFDSAVWNINAEPIPNDPDITIEGMGESALIHFVFDQTYTLYASMTDKNGDTYNGSLNIEVRDQYLDDEYLYICAKKGEPTSITPQFRLFSKEYPYGVLTTIIEDIDWVTSSISSMNPAISDGELVFTPNQSGKYSVYANYSPNTDDNMLKATTYYTIFVPEKEVNVGQSISSTGQQNEYVYFTPDATGRYKINWKSYNNSGYESLYDSDGNQVSRVNDVWGGYWLTEGETYFMELYYKTPTTDNSYSINLYRTGEDDSSQDSSDSESDDYTHSDVKPAPSVPSGQTTQSTGAGNNANGNSSSAQSVTVSKVKGKPKLKLKKGKVKLTFKKVKGADGYEICYATNKKFKKSKKMTVKSAKATLKKLKKGKKYFIKVRAFKRDASLKKVFGTYSKTVKITIKK